MVSEKAKSTQYPALLAFSQRVEALSAFKSAPLERGWQPLGTNK